FGVNTFRMENAAGETSLVKFHWKPENGVHSLLWEEAQLVNGFDPDFHRRDLADAIEGGHCPRWEIGLQIMPDTEDETFEGIDLLDPTKLVPEELAPVRTVGLLTLDRNPENYFAEDRKSTRLNSSHVSISYAVFCLKKTIIIALVTIFLFTIIVIIIFLANII